MENKPIKWAINFGFIVEPSMATCMNSICIWERKEIPNLVSVNLLLFHCARSSKIHIVLCSFYKSSTIGQAVRNGDLCDRFCEGQPKEYATFEA